MKKRKAKIIQDPKKRGEWVESVFMARASEQGLAVSKPWGDSRSFDFVVGRPGRFVGVQVKSTTVVAGGGYMCVIRKQNHGYARGSFDFVAAYVVPEDVWYIIPVSKIRGRENMSLCSNSKHNKNEEFREAWHLLKEASTSEEEGTASDEKDPGGERGGAEKAEDKAPIEAVRSHPVSAFGRMEAALNLFKQRVQPSGVRPAKRIEEA